MQDSVPMIALRPDTRFLEVDIGELPLELGGPGTEKSKGVTLGSC